MSKKERPQQNDGSKIENFSVRKALAEDLQDLVRMINSAYRDEQAISWKSEAELLGGQRTNAAAVQSLIDASDKMLFVLSKQSEDAAKTKLVGCVLLEKKETFSYLGMLTIHPSFQNQGLAKKLLTYSEQFIAQQWKLDKIVMTVIAQRTELIQYYQRFGYKLTGQQEPFPYGEENFGEPKRPDLYFEVLTKELKA